MQDASYRPALSPIITCYKLFGIWPMPESPWQTRIIRLTLWIFVQPIFIISQIPFLLLNFDDIPELTSSMCLLSTACANTIKNFANVSNIATVQAIISCFDLEIFTPKNERQAEMMRKGRKLLTTMYWTFITLGMSVPLLIVAAAFAGEERRLPLRAIFPFDYLASPWYFVLVVFQFVTSVYNCLLSISVDMLAAAFLIYIGIQIDILCDNLENLEEYSRVEARVTGSEISVEIHKLLASCIDHHVNILRLRKQVESLYDISIVLQFACNILCICATLFQLSQPNISLMQLIFLVEYQMAVAFQLMLYCWFGNEVTFKSNRIANCAFFSGWADFDVSFKKKLLFLIFRAQTPMRLYVGGIFSMSVETFLRVLQSSFSYYTLLTNLSE